MQFRELDSLRRNDVLDVPNRKESAEALHLKLNKM
jgi:hypothetical protein